MPLVHLSKRLTRLVVGLLMTGNAVPFQSAATPAINAARSFASPFVY
jgi:hypothetical protein